MAEETEGQNMSSHVAIDVLDSAFVDSIRQGLSVTTSSLPSNEEPTIYRVPMHFRRDKNEDYEPRLVSICPYHHDKQSLKPMEEHKWRYLQAILLRNPAVGLEDYLRKIKALDARRSYSESIELDSNEFLKMMLPDGCFIVELFAKHLKKEGDDDPIYGNWPLLATVSQDMLLLENQLPYCILQCIFSSVFPHEHMDVKLVEEAIRFYLDNFWLSISSHPRENSYHHLLLLIHCHFLPSTPKPETKVEMKHPTIPSAEKLVESGIKFKKKAGEYCALNVEFRNGVMEIPFLFIDDFTICLFRNCLALEQCYPSAGSYFAVYADFMDEIISTNTDVKILRNEGILEHYLGSDEELALLLNGLNKGIWVATNNFYLSALFNNVNEYCDTNWHRWRASLMHDYFRNPWAILALIAAILALFLTAIQSFFSVYAYARPPHQS